MLLLMLYIFHRWCHVFSLLRQTVIIIEAILKITIFHIRGMQNAWVVSNVFNDFTLDSFRIKVNNNYAACLPCAIRVMCKYFWLIKFLLKIILFLCVCFFPSRSLRRTEWKHLHKLCIYLVHTLHMIMQRTSNDIIPAALTTSTQRIMNM